MFEFKEMEILKFYKMFLIGKLKKVIGIKILYTRCYFDKMFYQNLKFHENISREFFPIGNTSLQKSRKRQIQHFFQPVIFFLNLNIFP